MNEFFHLGRMLIVIGLILAALGALYRHQHHSEPDSALFLPREIVVRVRVKVKHHLASRVKSW